MLIAGLVGGLGMIGLLSRQSFLKMLIGMVLLCYGMTLAFTLTSVWIDIKSQLFAFLILILTVGHLVVGFTLAVRLFILKQSVLLNGEKET